MEISASLAAFLKLGLILTAFLVGLRLKIDLWITILLGCVLVCFLTPVGFTDFARTAVAVPKDRGFTALIIMLFLILILSGVQAASGQNKRLVFALEKLIRSPRVRLVIFPALVGLLPMPGGALFSCPMLDDAANGIKLSQKRKSLINYWFRHIWETAWPLYPGFILFSSLLNVPLTKFMLYNAPFVIITFSVGWFLILKKPELSAPAVSVTSEEKKKARNILFYEGLPLIVMFLGALMVTIAIDLFNVDLPSQSAFIISVPFAIVTSVIQGKKELKIPLHKIVFNYTLIKTLLLIFAIYCFKDMISISGIVDDISTGGKSRFGAYALFIILPFVCGALTGIMVGYVGTAFPILISLAMSMDMGNEFMLLMMLSLIAGNAGQLMTPIHVCMAVTVDYFKTGVIPVVKALALPVLTNVTLCAIWAFILYFAGVRLI